MYEKQIRKTSTFFLWYFFQSNCKLHAIIQSVNINPYSVCLLSATCDQTPQGNNNNLQDVLSIPKISSKNSGVLGSKARVIKLHNLLFCL